MDAYGDLTALCGSTEYVTLLVWLLAIRNVYGIRSGTPDLSGRKVPGCTVDIVVIQTVAVLGSVIPVVTMFVGMTFCDSSWSMLTRGRS